MKFIILTTQRVFMPYVVGVFTYRQYCDEVVRKGYEGFELSP